MADDRHLEKLKM